LVQRLGLKWTHEISLTSLEYPTAILTCFFAGFDMFALKCISDKARSTTPTVTGRFDWGLTHLSDTIVHISLSRAACAEVLSFSDSCTSPDAKISMQISFWSFLPNALSRSLVLCDEQRANVRELSRGAMLNYGTYLDPGSKRSRTTAWESVGIGMWSAEVSALRRVKRLVHPPAATL